MSPQFVDFNADGRLDIVAGIFDGSPHVAYGTETGFAQPVQILDAKGERILLNAFWNFDTKKWDATTRCDVPQAKVPEGQCTSAVAFDWDHDGDFDLLLGDYRSGRLYRRMNEGGPREPKFASVNLPVLAGDSPLEIKGKLATPRLGDWDKDGVVDLVCSSIDGFVYLFRNAGRIGAPAFEAPQTLIARSNRIDPEPTRPNIGLYADVADFDGDGDFDLIVGGEASWSPPHRTLTPAEAERVTWLKTELESVEAATDAIHARIEAELTGLTEEVAEQRRAEARTKHKSEFGALRTKRYKLADELDALTPGLKKAYSVWLYLNEG
ncbi:MAG: FG-GAP repeat domain-containing protein [Planctomycetota bacterium]